MTSKNNFSIGHTPSMTSEKIITFGTDSVLTRNTKFMESRPLGQTSLKQFGIGVNGKAPFYPTIKRIDDDEKEDYCFA